MATGWAATYTKAGQDVPIVGAKRIKIDLELNANGSFEIDIPNPSDQQIADLAAETEIKITAWNNSLYGYVKMPQYSSATKTLTLKGSGYAILLDNVAINMNNTVEEDTSLSSTYRVIYSSKAFNVVAGDIITNTGITAGTITNFGTISIGFENKKVVDGVKALAQYAKYDWEVNSSKQLNMASRLGSATAVYQFSTYYNAVIINWESDSQTGKVYKVVVLGKGSGSTQIKSDDSTPGANGVASDFDTTDTAKNKIRIYQDPTISTAAQANQVAQNLFDFLNAEVVSATFSTTDRSQNVQIGDAIYLVDAKKGTSTLRVVHITRQLMGSEDSCTYEVIDNTSKLKRAKYEDFLQSNTSLTEALGSVSQGAIKTVTVDVLDNANTTYKATGNFQLPAEIASTSDIIKATLVMSRSPILYDAPSATDAANTGASITNNTAYTNSSISNASAYTTSSITNVAAGGASLVSGQTSSITATNINSASYVTVDYVTFSSTATAGAFVIWCGQIKLADGAGNKPYIILNDGTNNIGEQVIYVPARHKHDETGTGGGTTAYQEDGAGNTTVHYVGEPFTCCWYYPYSTANKQLFVRMHTTGGERFDVVGKLTAYSIATHTHSNTYNDATHTNNNSYNDATHTNPNAFNDTTHVNVIARGVLTPGGEGSLTLNADLNGSNVISASGAVTYKSSETDITSQIQAGGIGWQLLELYPSSGVARLGAQIKISYFVAQA